MPAATLTRTSEATPAVDAEVELLIREARRRTRRRRALLTSIVVAVATLVVGIAAFAASLRPQPAPAPAAPAAVADAAGAATPGTETELLVSAYIQHTSSHWHGVWLYIFDDGRVVEASPSGWEQRWLTDGGANVVRNLVRAWGRFDEAAQPRSPDDQGCCGYIQVRIDGELQILHHSWMVGGGPEDEWGTPETYRVSPQFDVVFERLTAMRWWVSEDLWTDSDRTPYAPSAYGVCENERIISSLPPEAATILRNAPPLETITPDVDRAFSEGVVPNVDDAECMQLAADEASALSRSLMAAGFSGSLDETDGWFSRGIGDSSIDLSIMPLLPNGVPAFKYG